MTSLTKQKKKLLTNATIQQTKMTSEEENSNKMVPGMTLIHLPYQHHFRSSEANLGAQGSTDGQNDFHQLKTYQQKNQFGIGPNLVPSHTNQYIQMGHLVPSLAPVMPMMNNQQLIQNLRAQGLTMFAGEFNQQPFGVQHQPSLNQMGIISNQAVT